MIALVTLNTDNYSNPTVRLLLKELNDRGEKILVIAPVQLIEKPGSFVNVIEYIINYRDPAVSKRLLPLISFFTFTLKILTQLYKHKCKVILAVDPLGLILATRLSFFKRNSRTHYMSFEILFKAGIVNDSFYTYIKKKEIRYANFLSSILIQDDKRQGLLISENEINSPKKLDWHFIAVSPEPITSPTTVEENKVRERYQLEPDVKLLLHTGTLAEWSGEQMYIDLLEQGLPEKHILFLHSRFKLTPDQKLHQKLMELQKKGYPVILHDEYIDDPLEYNNFMKSFDYGMLFYVPDHGIYTGQNIKDIGLASGKFSYYMACGIPVLASNCEVYSKLNNIYNFGVLVDDSKSASIALDNRALDTIDPKNCENIFNQYLNPQKPIKKYISYLMEKN